MAIRLTGQEVLTGAGAPVDATVSDFWEWAFSDLMDNGVRGVYGEWLVAKLLDVPLVKARGSWDEYDLLIDGIKVEVKTTGWMQSWNLEGPSKTVSFGSLRSRSWTYRGGYAKDQDYHADIYLFCVNTKKEASGWDALNLDQWTFYILPKAKLQELNYMAIGLTTVEKEAAPPKALNAGEFKLKFMEMHDALALTRT